MTEGTTGTPDQSPPRETNTPLNRTQTGGRHRRQTHPPLGATATPGDPSSFDYVMTRVVRPPDIPPIAWETLLARIGEIPTLVPEEPGIFDLEMDDSPVEIRGKDGKAIPQKELQKLLDEHPPEKIVVTPQIIKAILDNPNEKLKIKVAAVSEANEWLVALKSELDNWKTLPPTEEWAGEPQYIEVEDDSRILRILIPSGISVVDTGRQVPFGLKNIFSILHDHGVPDNVLAAIRGQFMHESHDWSVELDEDKYLRKELSVDRGRIDAYSPERREIGELKSDNPAELVDGAGQVLGYIIDLIRKYKIPHSGRLHFYHTNDIRTA